MLIEAAPQLQAVGYQLARLLLLREHLRLCLLLVITVFTFLCAERHSIDLARQTDDAALRPAGLRPTSRSDPARQQNRGPQVRRTA